MSDTNESCHWQLVHQMAAWVHLSVAFSQGGRVTAELM